MQAWRLAGRIGMVLGLCVGLGLGASAVAQQTYTLRAPVAAKAEHRGQSNVDLGDFYWIGGQRIDLLRRSDQLVVQLRASASADVVEDLVAPSGPLAGYAAVRDFGNGLRMFANPALAASRMAPVTAYTSLRGTLSRLDADARVQFAVPVFVNAELGTYAVATDELLVRLKPGVRPESVFADARFARFEQAPASDAHLVRVAAGAGEPVLALAAALQGDPRILWAEPNFYQERQRFFTPNDPLFPDQWHLNNTGQGGGTPGADAKLVPAWDVATAPGQGVVIAIVDDGPELTHPDLAVYTNPNEIAGNAIDDDGNGFVDDVSGWDFTSASGGDNDGGPSTVGDEHGTSVAGVAAARGNNSAGVTGAAFRATIFPARIFLGPTATSDANIGAALAYASGRARAPGTSNWRGADVVNNSWGGGGPSNAINDALTWAATNGRGGRGTPHFFATGNSGPVAISLPASLSGTIASVIAVGASNNIDVRSSYSQFGPQLDFVAPSNDQTNGGTLAIWTTDRLGAPGYNGLANLDYTNAFGGTSSATPLAAGVGALLLGMEPTLTVAQLRTLMRGTTDRIGPLAYDTSGFNVQYGYGRINANRAVRALNRASIGVDLGNASVTSGTAVTRTILAGQAQTLTFTVRSVGQLDLTLSGLQLTGPTSFTLSQPLGATTVPLGQSTTFGVTFSSLVAGTFNATASFTTNDADLPTFTIPIQFTVSPVSIGGKVFEDRNGDGVIQPGESVRAGETVYLDADNSGTQNPPTLTNFGSAANLGLVISNAAPIASSLSLSGLGPELQGLEVRVRLTHPFVSDVRLVLEAPNGTRVELVNGAGGSGDNMTDTVFADDATVAISAGTAPFTGRFRPNQPLSSFLFSNPNGTWTLRAFDSDPADNGTLVNWSLATRHSGERFRVSDALGDYAFVALAPGSYRVRSAPASGWSQVSPGGAHQVTITGTESNLGRDLGQARQNSVYGTVYNDVNGNGAYNAGTDTLRAGTTVFLDTNGNETLDPPVPITLSRNTAVPIPDVASVTDTLVSTTAGEISSLTVTLNLTHTWVSDLEIRLTSPAGTVVTLVDNRGGSGDNFTGTVFDDAAALAISGGAAPFTGSFRPEQPLSALAGQAAAGNWQLTVIDQAGGDTGTLLNWSLNLMMVGEPSQVTDSLGNFRLDGVSGNNSLRLIVPAGLVLSEPASGSYPLSLAAGQFVQNRNFGLVLPQADLAITKTNGSTSSTPGGSTTYTVTASNAGPAPAIGATVTDTFPATLSCNWTCVGAGGGVCTAAGSGNLSDTVNLPSGASVTYTASCTISAAATGSLSNTATVAVPNGVTDPTPGNNSATDTDTLAPSANLAISKTNGTTSTTPGGSTTYTITASNAGPSNANGSTVTDSFPAACTNVSWTCVGAGGGTCTASGSGNLNDTVNLPSGASVTYTASCAVNAGAIGTLSNTATVTVPGGVTDPVSGNNSATDTDTLSPQADLAITKTDGQSSVDAGTSAVYTINASNAGPSDAPAATVTDTFPAFCVSPTWTCTGAGGGSCTASGSGNIAQSVNLPAGGSVSFLATCPIAVAATGTLSNTATVAASGGVTDLVPANNSATDTAPIVAVPAPLLSINSVGLTEGDSGSQLLTFTVTSSNTTTAFTVDYATANGSANAGSDYTTTTGTLSFGAGGLPTRTIEVPVLGDLVAEGTETFTVTLSNATGLAQISTATGTGTISDNDVPGVTVAQSSGTTTVTEGGATDTYTLVLTSQPTANVTVAITPNAQLTTSPTSVVFTPANWATPQSVTVSAVNDAMAEGAHSGTIAHAVTSMDPMYGGLSVGGITATITDNDVAGVVITENSGTPNNNDITVTEGGAGSSVAVVLTSQPLSDVQVTMTFNQTLIQAGAPTPGNDPVALVFTSANWNLPQVVNVSAVNDNVVRDIGSTNLSLTVGSADPSYQAIATQPASPIVVRVIEDDVAGVVITENSGTPNNNDITVTEGGAGSGVTVVLTSQPLSDVQVTMTFNQTLIQAGAPTPGNDPVALVFTSANWNLPQVVNVSAVNDNVVRNIGSTNLSLTVGSADPNYQAIATQPVSPIVVRIIEDDAPGVTVTPSGGNTAVTEGGATDTYTLVLTSQPTANVVIALSGGAQLTATPGPVTFTAANWNVAQTVTVAAVDDAIAEGTHNGSVTHTVTSADPNYQGRLVDSVSATITDNDTAGVQVAESGGNTAVTEGGATDTLSVVLQSQPQSTVTVTITPNAQLTVSPSPLTFTSANWNVAQTVTVTAANDTVVEGSHAGTLGFSVASTDPAYAAITLPGITTAVTDNDAAVVSFAPASVSQSEASSPMVFTVTLSNPVASGVIVKVNSANGAATAGADYTAVSDQTVSFAANSTTAQTVSVAVTNDALDEDDETYSLTLSALSATGDVTLGTATATGTIEDDDALPVLSVANVTQAEGNAVNMLTFTVNLSPVSGRAVSFTRATVDGTAVSTAPTPDYAAIAASTVTIPAGQTSVTIPVTVNGDAVFEGDESFTLSLTGVANATPGTLSATATLTEDDQQPTTTTITADLPDPSVVGQGYPVTVEVRAQTLSPLGTVSISDGTGASCNAPLTAGTAPLSTMTCTLTSTSAGAKTLTATYTPANDAFAASNDTEGHQVNAAATSLILLGPARARIGTAASYTAELSVTAPGAGTPAGVVTVSSGASSCTITLPTATPSCTITFSTLGSRAVTASFAPSNGNFTGSTATPVQTLVFASSDVSVTKTNAVATYRPGDLLVYTVVVRNTGPDAAPQVRIRDVAPAGLTNVAWTCEASGGAVCPQSGGAGTLDHVVATLPSNGTLTYAYFGNVTGRPLTISNVAEVSLPVDTTIEDPNLANNSATDTDLLDDLFTDGFEAPGINAESGGVRLAAASLRSTGDEVARVTVRLSDIRGEALRVYARVIGGELQVALALRGADGTLRLGAWQRASGEPALTWTATPAAGGFVLSGATLR